MGLVSAYTRGERYYSRNNYRMHRFVWEHYNGKIPDGYDVHHKDGNTHNNSIENLEIVLEKNSHVGTRDKENDRQSGMVQKIP